MGDCVAALEQQLRDITKSELVAQAPQHGVEHDVGRVLKIVERRAGALVEEFSAVKARECAVAERGASPPPTGLARAAAWAGHAQSSPAPLVCATLAEDSVV